MFTLGTYRFSSFVVDKRKVHLERIVTKLFPSASTRITENIFFYSNFSRVGYFFTNFAETCLVSHIKESLQNDKTKVISI